MRTVDDVARSRPVIRGVAGALGSLLLMAGIATAAASDPRTAPLSPPVMHESFTPLPCTGKPADRDTLQQEGCAEQQILAGDKQIDRLNRGIFAALGTTSAKRDFIAGHRAWLAYRHAYCLSVSDVFQGGTEAGVLDADCTAELTAQHVRNLREFLRDLVP
jgi:uncharacterized protein YecT (DUF1311 family)